MTLHAYGLGIGRKSSDGRWLDVFFPKPVAEPDTKVAACFDGMDRCTTLDPLDLHALGEALANAGAANDAALTSRLADCESTPVLVLLPENDAPQSVPEAYLKLHLLSHRSVKPHGTSLDGLFGLLPNVAWTGEGPIAIDELPERQLTARLKGSFVVVDSVDKFPKMSDYVVPDGVRIADTARVRLGAHIGVGTTIMHEGFVNFNAGTLGAGMIEGRVSAGVVVGANSDLGGGCSTMGTLSGGGDIVISIGERCLLGANSGLGIPLGDRCTIEAGLYLTAGTKVALHDATGALLDTVAARSLAGQSGLLFRRNSRSGTVECLTNRTAIELNKALHAHN
ncbi:MAG: DapH/DapD/GlmU-related protein [Pseudomonadota bacterium]